MQTLEPLASVTERVRGIVEQELPGSLGDTGQAVTLPPACYTDPEFFAFEKDAIFYKEWLCLGRAEQIPNVGDYFSLTVVDEPLIVVRSSADQIRVLSAVCRHRGMVVTAPAQADLEAARQGVPETSGNSTLFRCPYHYWSYDLDGHLMSAPEMDRTPSFDPGVICLPSFPVELWNGFIFVNFDPDAAPLAPRLQRLSQIIENWHFEDLVDVEPTLMPDMPWNWKVMHENSIEAYHADRLHAGLHSPLPSTNVLPTGMRMVRQPSSRASVPPRRITR
jgi:phenylpropionate dioxygenase-like ring-hydroxylating dioxygenase large terminal subunit